MKNDTVLSKAIGRSRRREGEDRDTCIETEEGWSERETEG